MSHRELTFERLEKCPLCGTENHSFYDECPDSLVNDINRSLPADVDQLPQINNVRRKCTECGLIFLSPRLDKVSLPIIYEYWYKYAYTSVFYDELLIHNRLQQFRKYHLSTLNDNATTRNTLLDVGCGSGLFMKVAQESGWSVVGVEFDQKTAEAGKEAYGVEIRCGTIDSSIKDNETFDAITLFDYLEHSSTPAEDLQLLIRHLNEDGVLLVRVPNMKGWQSKFMGCGWLAVISNHLSYFSEDALKKHLESLGLEVIEVSAVNYQTEADILSQRWNWLKSKLQRTSTASQQTVPQLRSGEMKDGVFSAIRRLLYSLLIEQVDHAGGLFNKGNNLMIVARKR